MNKTRPLFLVCFLVLAGLFAFKSSADEVTISWRNGTYTGEVSLGTPHGKGTWTHPNGDRYVGEFKDGKKHGQGTYTFPSGENYVGEWKDDKRHGQGTLTFPDGEKYIGEFKKSNYHGQGIYTESDGSKYVGEFKDDNPWNVTHYDKDGEIFATYLEGVETKI